jgi:hypothetical protein
LALVGDIIVRCRENGPDLASFLVTPTATAPADAGAGGTLPAGTYYSVVTGMNQWGESLPTGEQSVVLGAANHKIGITINAGSAAPGTTGFRAYFSLGTQGAENGYIQLSGSSGTLTLVNLSDLLPGVPPIRATAMMPDTDGSYASAFTLFRWLNNAVQKASKIMGGIALLTGVQAITGNAMYRIPGRWVHFSRSWFDGWPVTYGRKADVFLRNAMNAIPGISSFEQGEDTTVLQLWPQPNRTGATTTLSVAMAIGDVQASVALTTSFLTIGLIQIDNEIMAYSGTSGNIFSGLIRGIGGTLPAAHLINAPVTELNFRLTGFKLPPDYVPGDSGKTLPIPPACDEPLTDYLTAQFKKSELDNQEALQIEKQFEASIRQIWKESRPPTKPAQIGSNPIETYGGGWAGGIIIP